MQYSTTFHFHSFKYSTFATIALYKTFPKHIQYVPQKRLQTNRISQGYSRVGYIKVSSVTTRVLN